MPFISPSDGTQLYWRDWGEGAPVSHENAFALPVDRSQVDHAVALGVPHHRFSDAFASELREVGGKRIRA
jgi:hypothetical protein